MPTDRFGGQVVQTQGGRDRFGGQLTATQTPEPSFTPVDEAPQGDTWAGNLQAFVQGAADFLPVTLPSTVLGLPGSIANTAAELYQGEPQGFEQTGIMGVPDYRDFFAEQVDRAKAGVVRPMTPVNELPAEEMRYTPTDLSEQAFNAAGEGAAGVLRDLPP